ncbi:Hypothetical protein ING2D1G_0684 [Peptoniphilus sp. ING2-D1G]|nr:Hypothetical protein ING2D1G_0684 [Peptoniphilus sp. ING2-D1G]
MTILSFPKFYKKYKDSIDVGRESLRKIVKRKGFPCFMVGSQPRIIEEEAIEYLKTNYGFQIR